MIKKFLEWWNRPPPPAWSLWAGVFEDCKRCDFPIMRRIWREDGLVITKCSNCGLLHETPPDTGDKK